MFKSVLFALIIFTTLVAKADANADFATWLADLKQEAKKNNITQTTIDKTFKNAKFLPRVIMLDRGQPEFISPFLNYVENRVTPSKIVIGRAMLSRLSI